MPATVVVVDANEQIVGGSIPPSSSRPKAVGMTIPFHLIVDPRLDPPRCRRNDGAETYARLPPCLRCTPPRCRRNEGRGKLSAASLLFSSILCLSAVETTGGELGAAALLIFGVLPLDTDESLSNRERDREIIAAALLVSGDLKHG
jgi:hypothetical protein